LSMLMYPGGGRFTDLSLGPARFA